MSDIVLQAKEALLLRKASLQRLIEDNRGIQRAAPEPEPDWPDRAAAQEAAVVLERLSKEEQVELDNIDAALTRIDSGRYGACEVCRGAIGRLRLRALPEARLCVRCSEQQERNPT